MFGSVLSGDAQTVLAVLGGSGLLPPDTYLAGGSALALQFGHRYSVDFDFFTPQGFDPKKLSQSLKRLGNFHATTSKGITLIGDFEGIKMSVFRYEYPLLVTPSSYLGVALAHPHDIAAMKLVALTDRGLKRDFVDLYELIHQGISVHKMFELYDQKYQFLEANRFTLIKSLGYFDDAEGSDMPKMIKPVTWDAVKTFFSAESMRLAKELLEL